MTRRDLVAIGASAGGIEALRTLIHCLPRDFDAAVVLAVHMAPTRRSELATLLGAIGTIEAVTAEDGMPLQRKRIHVAPPNQHLVVEGDALRLDSGPRENGFRPAIDRMFRSAALARGSRAIGVVLSGMLDDGSEGLALIKRCGGLAIVQEPSTAAYASMPQSAIDNVAVDHVVPIERMASMLVNAVGSDTGVTRTGGDTTG